MRVEFFEFRICGLLTRCLLLQWTIEPFLVYIACVVCKVVELKDGAPTQLMVCNPIVYPALQSDQGSTLKTGL